MRKLLVLVAAVPFLCLIAGLYGALHDQLSYTISPEYFTKFKYGQFGFEPQWFGGHRATVAVIGFLATWWVGLIIGLFVAGTALFQPDARRMRTAILRATRIVFGVAVICALIGLATGWWFIRDLPAGWYLPDDVVDRHAFLSVGSMHNFSYGGGLLGLMLALIDMEWRRQKAKQKERSGAV
ncbi:MAG TPA: hypothetical protein VGE21_05980 [Flavobacteriales bacterium]